MSNGKACSCCGVKFLLMIIRNHIHLKSFLILILLISGLSGKDYKGSELRTIASYTYGRFEVRMQSAFGSGMLSSFFTYHDDGIAWNEIDIEILGQYTDQIQLNTITPGQINHVYTHDADYNPHDSFHVYAFEWAPDYVAWFIDDIEVYRDQGNHISQLNLAQKIMMNMWIPDYPDWVGPWNDSILPVYAFYDWVKYSSYTPGSGDTGSDNSFSLQWMDNFEYWDQSRWQKATHTWWGNNCDFTPENVVFQDGYMILCLTDNFNLGFSGEIPADDRTYLRRDGQEILDRDGNPILLKGLGLGGWLVPEGYMLHIPGYGSPSAIQNMIVDLVGEGVAQSFYNNYEQNYVNSSDIAQIAEWGFNSVRLPFHYNKLSPETGVYLEGGFAQIDSLLKWCEQNELYLILDMHCAPGGQNPNNISDSGGEALLWTMPEHQEHTIQLWQVIAERYENEEWMGGYDLLNEPVLPSGYSNTHLRNLYMDIRSAIRSVDQNHILFIEGNWYATDFTNLTPPFDGNMVYSFHKYWNETGIETIQNYLAVRNAYNIPLWLGESGENSNQWFAEMIELVESNNIGWNWWTHKKLDTITSPLSAPIPNQFQTVLDYWNNGGVQPPTYVSISGLMLLAENLAIENCEIHQDVLMALLNWEELQVNMPFKTHVLPGTIDAVDYDMGLNTVSYSDVQFMTTDGSSGDAWNSGYSYRNDGVDIELSGGDSPTMYNIGWTQDDEWLEYSIQVQETGVFTVWMTVATPNGGFFRLYLDGEDLIGLVNVNPTDDWQNWTNQNMGEVILPVGDHILQLYITQGGFNISQIMFEPMSMIGDLTMDMTVDVLDIVALVNLILFAEPNDLAPKSCTMF